MENKKDKNVCNTLVSLKTYMDMRLDDITKASDLAAENLKIRLDSLNEWRLQNKDERMHFLSNEVFNSKHEFVEAKINSLEKLIYIGLGIILTLEFTFRFLIK